MNERFWVLKREELYVGFSIGSLGVEVPFATAKMIASGLRWETKQREAERFVTRARARRFARRIAGTRIVRVRLRPERWDR